MLTNLVCISENKIDAIEERLSRIESLLRGMAVATKKPPEQSEVPKMSPATPVGASIAVTPAPHSAKPIQHFEGDTSLSAHTTFASDYLQRALRNTQMLSQDPDLASALSALSQVVSKQNIYPSDQDLPTTTMRAGGRRQKYSMPPAEVVSLVLREVKGSSQSLSPTQD